MGPMKITQPILIQSVSNQFDIEEAHMFKFPENPERIFINTESNDFPKGKLKYHQC